MLIYNSTPLYSKSIGSKVWILLVGTTFKIFRVPKLLKLTNERVCLKKFGYLYDQWRGQDFIRGYFPASWGGVFLLSGGLMSISLYTQKQVTEFFGMFEKTLSNEGQRQKKREREMAYIIKHRLNV